jgi:hypothetical protein
MISHRIRPVGRRDLLGLAATAFVVAISLRLARAQAARGRLGDGTGRIT